MIFVDSNILIDIFAADQHWRAWSDKHLLALSDAGEAFVTNLIVLAEIAGNFSDAPAARVALEDLDIDVLPLSDDAAFAAGHAFRTYRRDQQQRSAILADFLIAAHAQHLGATLLTRDRRIRRTYFPHLTLITPETDHG